MGRDLTKDELAAVEGMGQGDLKPLADLLAHESDSVHPIVQRFLRQLIDGTAEETDFRLKVVRHPGVGNKQSQAYQAQQSGEEMMTALKMARNGALSSGMFESAIAATIEQTGLKRSAVTDHWRRQKGYILRGLQNGTIDDSILPGPIDERHLSKSK